MWTTSFKTAVTTEPITLQVFGKQAPKSKQPVVLYFHGGLFNSGNIEHAYPLATALAEQMIVVCVDYPLAPSVQFPATIEVAFAALRWVADNAQRIGADTKKIFVAGEHAGGNLAAVVAMLFRDRAMHCKQPTQLSGQILINPMLDALQTSKSMGATVNSPCRRAWADYVPAASDAMHPYVSPVNSCRLARLAPALVITSHAHPLRDEAEAYASKLLLAGVPVQVRRLADSAQPLTAPGQPTFNHVCLRIRQFILA